MANIQGGAEILEWIAADAQGSNLAVLMRFHSLPAMLSIVRPFNVEDGRAVFLTQNHARVSVCCVKLLVHRGPC